MGNRRVVVVVVIIVRLSGKARVQSDRVAGDSSLTEVMMAKRNGEVQRKRRKRKPCSQPRSWPKPPHCAPRFATALGDP